MFETLSGQQSSLKDDAQTTGDTQNSSHRTAPNGTGASSDKHDTIEDVLKRDSRPKTEQNPGLVANLLNKGQDAIDAASDSVRRVIDNQAGPASQGATA